MTIAHALLQNTHFKVQSQYLSLVLFHTVRSGAYWHKIDGIYACTFAEQKKLVFEMLFIKRLKPNFNVQADSIRAKLFV